MNKDTNKNEDKSNFDFSFLITLLLDNHLSKELRHLPKYEYFLSLIFKEQKGTDMFVPVSNRLLKKLIRQPIINRVKKHLLQLGLIECNFKMRFELKKGERVGTEPYSYRLTDKFYRLTTTQGIIADIKHNGNGDGFSIEKIDALRNTFAEKVRGVHQNRWAELINLPQKPEYNFIQENALRLEINPFVYDWIDEQVKNRLPLKPSQCEFINQQGKLVRYLKKNRFLNEDIADQWKYHAGKIEKKNFHFSCPASVNRVFYNITNMPSELRNFLRYKGHELYYLDYSNFQPFLFNKLLKEKFTGEMPADVKKYIELTSEGLFYAEVKLLIESAGLEIKDHDNFKVDFFGKVFFSSEKRRYKLRTVFEQHFPNVSALISETKAGNYKALSVQLQRLESKIVISTILREIAQQKPEAFVLPIHDALVCEKQQFSYVQQLMIEKTEQIIGFRPTIKHELLSSKAEKELL